MFLTIQEPPDLLRGCNDFQDYGRLLADIVTKLSTHFLFITKFDSSKILESLD